MAQKKRALNQSGLDLNIMEFPRRLKNGGAETLFRENDVKHVIVITHYFCAQNSLGFPVHLEQKVKY